MTATDKNALVTGAGRRIGRAIALSLADAGWSVALHVRSARSAEEAHPIADEIRAKGSRAVIITGDLAAPETASRLVPEACEAFGPLNLLVNNASEFKTDEALTITETSWDEHMTVNLRAPAFLSQAFAAQLPEGQHGNIINIIDQRVWAPTPRFFSYTISKMALWDMTQVLARSLAPNIRVNGIGPGPTLANARQSSSDFSRQTQGTILKRGTSPEEICAAVHFILAAPAMTGQMIALDGGQHLAWETPDIAGIQE